MTVALSAGEEGQSSDSTRLMLVMECSLRMVGGGWEGEKEGKGEGRRDEG